MEEQRSNGRNPDHCMIVAAISIMAAPVVLVIAWLIWQNWDRMDAHDVVFIAALPAMILLQLLIDWLFSRRAIRKWTKPIPLHQVTRTQVAQTAPFVIFLFFAAAATIPELNVWDLLLRLTAFWIVTTTAVELWMRYGERRQRSKN